ncbi:MAG: kelch repeat-containing protein, partial [candidate division WOR-3 bacterium]
MKREKIYMFLIISLFPFQTLYSTINWNFKNQMPTGRDGLGIGVVRDTVYCIGGWTNGSPSGATGACEAYIPSTDTWLTRSPMPTPRGFLAVCVANDKIYAIGGWNGSSSALTVVEEYNPATNTWTPKTSMSVGRSGLGAETVNGKIYAIGGFFSNVVEEFNPAINTWTTKTSMPQPRGFFASEVVGDKIYVAAGRNNNGDVGPTYEYTPSSDTAGGTPWQIKASIPTLRYHPEAAVVNGKIYVCGGLAQTGEVATVEVYDPLTDNWVVETPMNTRRRELDVGAVGNKIYAIGGWPQGMYQINEEGEVIAKIKENITHYQKTRGAHLTSFPNPFNNRTFIKYQICDEKSIINKKQKATLT